MDAVAAVPPSKAPNYIHYTFSFFVFCDVVLVICVTKVWKVATQSHWACKTMKGHDKTKVQPPTASQHACKQERNIRGQQGWVEERNIHNNKRNTTTWQPCRHGMHKNLTQCAMPNQRKNNHRHHRKDQCTQTMKGQQSTVHANQGQSHTDTEVYGQRHWKHTEVSQRASKPTDSLQHREQTEGRKWQQTRHNRQTPKIKGGYSKSLSLHNHEGTWKMKVQPPTTSQHACKQERNIGGQHGWVAERNIHSNKHNTTAWQPCRHGMHKTLAQCTMPKHRKNNQADNIEKTDTPRQWRGNKAQCMLAKDKATQTKKSMGRGTGNMHKHHKRQACQQTACKT